MFRITRIAICPPRAREGSRCHHWAHCLERALGSFMKYLSLPLSGSVNTFAVSLKMGFASFFFFFWVKRTIAIKGSIQHVSGGDNTSLKGVPSDSLPAWTVWQNASWKGSPERYWNSITCASEPPTGLYKDSLLTGTKYEPCDFFICVSGAPLT